MRYVDALTLFTVMLLATTLVVLPGCREDEATDPSGAADAMGPGPDRALPTADADAPTSEPTRQWEADTYQADEPVETASLPRVELEDINRIIDETAEQDRVLVLDFWATWCAPCVEQFPTIHQGVKDIGLDRARPVSITFDAGPREQDAIAFLRKHNAMDDAYMIMPDTDKQAKVVDALGQQWTNLNVPAWFVFNRDGQMVGEYYRADDVPAMLEQVRQLAEADAAQNP